MQRRRVLLVAQVADGDEVGVARRARRAQRRRRLDDHDRLGAAGGVEPRQARPPAGRRCGWHTRANAVRPRRRRDRDRGPCRSARATIGASARRSRQRAIGAAERRACRAISRSACASSASSPSTPTMSTRATGARKRCQRAAVCQLPLLAAASAGETMRTRGSGDRNTFMLRVAVFAPGRGRAGSRRSSIDDGTAPRPTMAADARLLAGTALADALRDARATTLARTMDQDDDAWNVAQQAGVNLPAWELGHLAWFAEFWILRGPHRAGADGFVAAAKPPVDRRARCDLRLGPARARRPLARRAAVARRAGDAPRRASSTPASTPSRAMRTTTTRTTSTASRSSTRTCTARRSPGCARRSAGRRRRAWRCRRCRRASRCASTAARSSSAARPTSAASRSTTSSRRCRCASRRSRSTRRR